MGPIVGTCLESAMRHPRHWSPLSCVLIGIAFGVLLWLACFFLLPWYPTQPSMNIHMPETSFDVDPLTTVQALALVGVLLVALVLSAGAFVLIKRVLSRWILPSAASTPR